MVVDGPVEYPRDQQLIDTRDLLQRLDLLDAARAAWRSDGCDIDVVLLSSIGELAADVGSLASAMAQRGKDAGMRYTTPQRELQPSRKARRPWRFAKWLGD